MSRAWVYTLAAAVLLGGASARAATRHVPQQRIDDAVARAVGYLTRQIGEDGRCKGEFRPDDMRQGFGGKTALCLYALLGAGADYREGPVKRAMDWLLAAELKGSYAVSMRACALAAVYTGLTLTAALCLAALLCVFSSCLVSPVALLGSGLCDGSDRGNRTPNFSAPDGVCCH